MRFLKLFGSYCLLLVMAMAGTAHAQQPVLDKDYKLITPPQKTDSGKKVEVVEFFSYAYELEEVLAMVRNVYAG